VTTMKWIWYSCSTFLILLTLFIRARYHSLTWRPTLLRRYAECFFFCNCIQISQWHYLWSSRLLVTFQVQYDHNKRVRYTMAWQDCSTKHCQIKLMACTSIYRRQEFPTWSLWICSIAALVMLDTQGMNPLTLGATYNYEALWVYLCDKYVICWLLNTERN
jgi:hypothetical protein